ncbi:hypothetical protein FGIG_11423 [Fasciola gigantica]|uniref:Uncharacterized protein n=1 Tax=Fasciola gigantica TaxID=46835 RepID=A0A504YLQ5_FASGI|nr:hypothetical protein FGIG_11423 [Fasciola gigantica]
MTPVAPLRRLIARDEVEGAMHNNLSYPFADSVAVTRPYSLPLSPHPPPSVHHPSYHQQHQFFAALTAAAAVASAAAAAAATNQDGTIPGRPQFYASSVPSSPAAMLAHTELTVSESLHGA